MAVADLAQSKYVEVSSWIKELVGKEVKGPEDLQSGVIFAEVLNKLKPETVKKYDSEPKNLFRKAENFRRINLALVKFGISPGQLPVASQAASGNANSQILGLLSSLKSRAPQLREAPVRVVKKASVDLKNQIKIREHLLKKHKRAEILRIQGAVRAAKYQREYKKTREDIIAKHRKAEKNGNYYVPPEPKVAFVIRIRGINGIPPKPKKILQLFRLRQIHNGVFVKLNKASLNMLKFIEPYVAFGYPSVKTIRALLLKRGFASINHQRVAITSNEIIHKKLGKCRVHNLDDLVHEIATCGKNFTRVNRFLWPFKLNSPRGGYGKSKLRHFAEGGAVGNRLGLINKFIRKCL